MPFQIKEETEVRKQIKPTDFQADFQEKTKAYLQFSSQSIMRRDDNNRYNSAAISNSR